MLPHSAHQKKMDTVSGYWKGVQETVGAALPQGLGHGALGSFISSATGAPPPEPVEKSWTDDVNDMTTLTTKQRIGGFVLSLVMGVTFVCIAIAFVPTLALFPRKFAFFFTCGSFFLLCSTSFLVGPSRQLKSMLEAHRIQAATGFLLSMAMTLVAALHWSSMVFSVLFAGLQIFSSVWYALSYVPFARRFVALCWSYIWVVLKPVLAFITPLVGKFCGLCCRCLANRVVS
jgi:hypothetical protein